MIPMLRTLSTAAAVTLALIALPPAFAADDKMPRTISLTGHGEVRQAPDIAIVSIGVLSQAPAADEALAANTAAMQAAFAALKTAGIEDKDIQTANFMVQPRYDYNNEGRAPKLVGYDVSNTVSVTVRKLEALGAMLDRVVAAGSNQINGIQFDVSSPDAALDAARKLAVADARRKAEIYAAAGNVVLGDIIAISEGVEFRPPEPVLRAKAMRAEMTADVPIAQGEQRLGIDVNIVWDIR
jgi:uncharacterized protein YggE